MGAADPAADVGGGGSGGVRPVPSLSLRLGTSPPHHPLADLAEGRGSSAGDHGDDGQREGWRQRSGSVAGDRGGGGGWIRVRVSIFFVFVSIFSRAGG